VRGREREGEEVEKRYVWIIDDIEVMPSRVVVHIPVAVSSSISPK
jgi:hypothetical protein